VLSSTTISLSGCWDLAAKLLLLMLLKVCAANLGTHDDYAARTFVS